jgi:hypothetical protein
MSEELALIPNYRLTCPWCNGRLYPIAFTPDSAPWICVICSHAWWVAELSEEARKRFRPAMCDFGFGPGLEELQEKVKLEREEARARDTSVRSDQIQLLPLYVLQRLSREGRFGELVQLEITRKGG